MAAAWPMAIVVTEASTTGTTTSGVLIKRPVDQGLPGATNNYPATIAQAHPNTGHERALAALNTHVAGLGFPAIEIDALSSGNALLNAAAHSGSPQLGNAWLAVAVSVASGGGSQTGSLFSHVANSPNGDAGSHLVGYYYNQSQGIGSALPGRTVLEANRTQLGFPSGQNHDVSALDLGIAVQQAPPSGAVSRLFPSREILFFSVSPAWANDPAVDGVNFALTGQTSTSMAPADPADIYLMRRDSLGVWTGPHRWATADQLGFAPGPDNNVDGLDVDMGGTVLFSAKRGNDYYHEEPTGAPPYDIRNMNQLMVVQLQFDPTGLYVDQQTSSPRPLTDRMTDPQQAAAPEFVSHQIGAGEQNPPLLPPEVEPQEDEVDAVCTWDPEDDILDTAVGIPGPHYPRTPVPMSLSLVRVSDPNQTGATNPGMWLAQLSGWGGTADDAPNSSGSPTDPPSTVKFFIREGDLPRRSDSPFPFRGWKHLLTTTRAPGQESVKVRFPVAYVSQDQAEKEYSVFALQIGPNGQTIGSWTSSFLAQHEQ